MTFEYLNISVAQKHYLLIYPCLSLIHYYVTQLYGDDLMFWRDSGLLWDSLEFTLERLWGSLVYYGITLKVFLRSLMVFWGHI